ncbi:MAG: hypothetical protein AB1776_08410 [Bacillota bacterium]
MRRFELTLPEEHPLWRVPPRQRAATARRWLELGRQAEEKRQDLEERLARVEERLARLEAQGAAQTGVEDRGTRIDPNAFLGAFEIG